eukprot:gene7828-16008_t
MFKVILLFGFAALANSFLFTRFTRYSYPTVLRASTGGPNDDALKAIREKMAADPSYNPMSDPQAVQIIESMIPDTMRELPNAIERVNVAFKDATTGQDAVGDVDTLSSVMSKEDAISSPQSKWFKEKFPEDTPAYSESQKDDLLKKARAKFPDVPTN